MSDHYLEQTTAVNSRFGPLRPFIVGFLEERVTYDRSLEPSPVGPKGILEIRKINWPPSLSLPLWIGSLPSSHTPDWGNRGLFSDFTDFPSNLDGGSSPWRMMLPVVAALDRGHSEFGQLRLFIVPWSLWIME